MLPQDFQADLAEIENINIATASIPLTQTSKPLPDLLALERDELKNVVLSFGQPAFRANQIWDWLYRKFAAEYSELGNLPRPLLEKLQGNYRLAPLEVIAEKVAHDGQTRKALFRLWDGAEIETVLMLYSDRATVCVSTQAGCAMACSFCATGLMGLNRNLTAGEILQQILHYERFLINTEDQKLTLGHKRVSNLVFMGMGEPLANYLNLWKAIRRLHDPDGINLSARKMTVSTVGLPQMIKRFGQEELPVNLALSLHAPNDTLRSQMMPISRRYPIAELIEACRDYIANTNRRLSFEYTLVEEVNDTVACARELGKLIKGMLCHVNLIPMNPVPGSSQRGSDINRVKVFQAELTRYGIPNSVRVEMGRDIQAACGQLKVAQDGKHSRLSQ
ncbi:MAG: 23S rRNA (adenine(2503)-C(2))-methyltransferase RlmN [Chloroflexi bacterium]|uniref:Probable dual-specificity RNA methyltransferase RlmN n=1 Tax=Candidatus Chlorohelix allophototropha TaxID=3003348 RepID=A0A8T7LZI9_9CHLR|nr:23S rRNA (adenine(2503)-C(2))-methyltransferase RlmN [Chloroflexota bacterium]WJW66860.1 23S rRNA (adenine(2503)-C(2))-methyltransferase RlmN [Chloroflexota bacterium L227-S17]